MKESASSIPTSLCSGLLGVEAFYLNNSITAETSYYEHLNVRLRNYRERMGKKPA